MVTVGTPPAVIRSPQSPGVSAVRKLTAMALLQHVAMVVLVVDDVEVEVLEVLVRDVEVDVLVRDVEVELEVDALEVLVRDVEVDVDVLVRDVEVELEVDVLEVLVRDVDVEVDDVVAGGAVELLVELVDVVPPDGDPQAFGAGESLRLSTPSTFLTSRPPNSAQ